MRRAGVALTLQAIVNGGRSAFYLGTFGEGLIELGQGLFTEHDLARVQADWVEPIVADALGVQLATIGPNSQAYLALGAARLADELGVPDDPADPAWPHLLIEISAAAAVDRPAVLHDDADGAALVDQIASRGSLVDRQRASRRHASTVPGDTTYLCTADDSGMAVSLIQSNASGFGSWLVEPMTGINLHNRGLGFSAQAGHPAEYRPGRRPPHTLCPAMATTRRRPRRRFRHDGR